jgi:hypothetical protein
MEMFCGSEMSQARRKIVQAYGLRPSPPRPYLACGDTAADGGVDFDFADAEAAVFDEGDGEPIASAGGESSICPAALRMA